VRHQVLEDCLAGRERLGRRLRGLEIRALRGQRAACRGHLGRLGCRQVGGATAGRTTASVVAAGWAVIATRWAISIRSIVPAGRPVAKATVVASWASGVARPIVAARRAVVTPRWAVAEPAILAWSVVARSVLTRSVLTRPGRGRRERDGGGRIALWRGAAQGGPGCGNDPCRLGTHAQDAPAAGGQDLEVEVIELGPKRLSGEAKRLLDGLSGELAVLTH
jgi:hypothetical protein